MLHYIQVTMVTCYVGKCQLGESIVNNNQTLDLERIQYHHDSLWIPTVE